MEDESPTPLARFDRIEASDDPAKFVECLELQERTPAIQRWREQTYEQLWPADGHAVVDVGCGTGTAVAALAGLVGPTGRSIGVDLSGTLVDHARRNIGDMRGVELHVADALALPLFDAEVDGYRAERLFQHLPDQPGALAEAKRVLRAGGRIVIADGDPASIAIDGTDKEIGRAHV